MHKEPECTSALNARAMYRPGETLRPTRDFRLYVREYAREKPEVVALWCLGIGFVLEWKLKPW